MHATVLIFNQNTNILTFCKICTSNTPISMNNMSRQRLLILFNIQKMCRIEKKTIYFRLIADTHLYYVYIFISYFAIGAKVSMNKGRGGTYLQMCFPPKPPLFVVDKYKINHDFSPKAEFYDNFKTNAEG